MISETQAILELERRLPLAQQICRSSRTFWPTTIFTSWATARPRTRPTISKPSANGPRVPERGRLMVRVYGDTAVMAGDILNRINTPGKSRG